MSLEDKQAHGCNCMGISALRESSCNFPGLGKYYDPAIDQPASRSSPPPSAIRRPSRCCLIRPQNPPIRTTSWLWPNICTALQDYQDKVDKIRADYKVQVE